MKHFGSIARSAARALPSRILPAPERAGAFGFFASLALLVFLLGFASAYFRFFPYRLLENALVSASVLMDMHKGAPEYSEFAYTGMEDRPSFENVPRGSEGAGHLTVINYFHKPEVHLVNGRGRVIHTYAPKLPESDREFLYERFSEEYQALDSAEHLSIQKIHIHENGDATLMLNIVGSRWSYGAGLLRVDRDSNILWKSFIFHTHHDFDIAGDGRIYTLAYKQQETPAKGLESLPAPYTDHHAVVLSPDGKVEERVSLLKALKRSRYGFYIGNGNLLPLHNTGAEGDYLHANNVDLVTEADARVFPYADKGDLLISMRDIHAIGVLDMEARKFTWLKRGPWIAQHDPDILPNGNLLIFDNLGADGGSGKSRIIEYDPRAERVVWSYSGSAGQPFETDIRGSQQPLENGNVLISETMGSRVFEVTRDGRIVWQLVSPFRFGEKQQLAPVVRWPRRLNVSRFNAEFRAFLREAAKTSAPLGADETAQADGSR